MKNRLLSFAWFFAILFVLIATFTAQAQTAPVASAPSAAVVSAAPNFLTTLLQSGELWTAIITAASVVFGIWQNKNANTKQKVAQSLVKVIEAASELPTVKTAFAGGVNSLKTMAQSEATALGVQDDLHKIVTNLTPQS